jgi:hypothetical protein
MDNRCTLTPGCEFGPHEVSAHPCGKPIRVGDPCEFCGDPTGADENGQPVACPRCWIPIPANLADAKALLALGGFSVDTPPDVNQA